MQTSRNSPAAWVLPRLRDTRHHRHHNIPVLHQEQHDAVGLEQFGQRVVAAHLLPLKGVYGA